MEELKDCLDDDGDESDDYDNVERYTPWQGRLQTEEKQCDGDFDERDRPVPEELGYEEEAEGGGASRGGNEDRAAAEAMENGGGEDEILDQGEELGV